MQATQKATLKSADTGLQAAMRTVFWLAAEGIALSKYPSLINLQKLQGCQPITDKLSHAKNATYSSLNSAEEFLACIAESIHSKILAKIKGQPFAVLTDESTDIAVTKQMIVYVKYVDGDFVPHTHFLGNLAIDNPKSDSEVLFNLLISFLTKEDLSQSNAYGFGSDGAAVMVGKRKGVATRFKSKNGHCVSIHCLAHRLNLCTSQASKNIKYLKTFEETLSNLFYYFGGTKSGNRKCELEEIQKQLKEPLVKMKECHEIRWLAFHDAVKAVYRSWGSLTAFFKKHSDKSSKSYFESLTDYRFLVILHMMMDILPSVSQLSLIFQKTDVDVSAIQPSVDSLKEKLKNVERGKGHFQREFIEVVEKIKHKESGDLKGVKFKKVDLCFGKSFTDTAKECENIRNEFCTALLKNIEERFPSESMDIAMAFHVLGMRPLSFLSSEDIVRGNFKFCVTIMAKILMKVEK